MTGESVALDMKAYSYVLAEKRVRIDELRNREGLGVRQIAPRIGRDKSTVSRECLSSNKSACRHQLI